MFKNLNVKNMDKSYKTGISLIVLIITIIVIIILAGAVIMLATGNTESARKARFYNDITAVQEAVTYNDIMGKFEDDAKREQIIKNFGKMSDEEKIESIEKVPTLDQTVKFLNEGKSILSRNMYWLDTESMSLQNADKRKNKEKIKASYIVDLDTLQVYDYAGEYFEKKRWHTLKVGVVDNNGNNGGNQGENPGDDDSNVPEGFMRLHLTYPEGSVERQWRLGSLGELRNDPILEWQNYEGAILIPITRISDVWIRYSLNGKEVTVAPPGKVMVDINAKPAGPKKVEEVDVNIKYEEGSINQQYKIGESGWLDYEGEFKVTQNTVIEARCIKKIEAKDTNGNVLGYIDAVGKDKLQISHIGEEVSELPAPTLEQLEPSNSNEKARVKATYPEIAKRKIYKINVGSEQEYISEIPIFKYGTNVIAYYYDESGKKSKDTNLTVEADELSVDILQDPNPQLDPKAKEVKVIIEYDKRATKKTYKLENGIEKTYTEPFIVTENTKIVANATNDDGQIGKSESEVKFLNLKAPKINQTLIEDKTKARIDISYDNAAITKQYSIDGGELLDYTGPFEVEKNGIVIYAINKNARDQEESSSHTVNGIEKLKAPKISQKLSSDEQTATITIEYMEGTTIKQYRVDGGTMQDYTGPFEITKNGTVIEALAKLENEEKTDKHIVSLKAIGKPKIIPNISQDKFKISITIEYDNTATVKQYSIDGGTMIDYAGPFEVTKNGIKITATNSNNKGEEANDSYTTKGIEELKAPEISAPLSADKKKATVTIKYDERATKKQYSINGGDLQDYTGTFDVIENNTTIYAINENAYGDKADKSLTVTGIENIGKPKIIPTLSEDKFKVTITIEYDKVATIKQYSIDGGTMLDYTGPFEVTKNGIKIEAVNKLSSTVEAKDEYIVSGIVELKTPEITAPLNADKSKATVTIKYDERATKKQYSINGGELKTYTAPFEIQEDDTVIYAVNESAYGDSKDKSHTITGIIKKLEVKITLAPDTTELVDKVIATIQYDVNATEKKYTLNGSVEKDYTGPIEITKKGTLKAVARATKSYGEDIKDIKNITDGIVSPKFSMDKVEVQTGENAKISIEYDNLAVVKKYRINGGTLQNYTAPFIVEQNDTYIEAYSADKFGNEATANYTVKGLIKYLLITKDKYYHVKLSYPSESIDREYKYLETGIWKEYKEAGFILVKPEYESELIQGGKLVKIEVEPGQFEEFEGDWYIYESDPLKFNGDIFMKWGYEDGKGVTRYPVQILPLTSKPLLSVDIAIIYPQNSVQRLYKIDDGEYQTYEGIIKVAKNGTKITAKAQYSNLEWSEEVTYTVNNLEQTGTINIVPNPATWTNQDVNVEMAYSKLVPEDYELQYNINDTGWKKYGVNLAISQNSLIKARLYNALTNDIQVPTSLNISNIDKVTPQNAQVNVFADGASLAGTINLVDNESGIDYTKSKYIINTTNTIYLPGNNIWNTSEAKKITTSPQNISEEKPDGVYYIHTLSIDKAGNGIINMTAKIDVSSINKPALAQGMTPIKWNGTDWINTTSDDTSWYDYENKQWANAQTADGSFWVWIPRYEYKIQNPHTSTAEEILINFKGGISTTTTSGYILHPAFTFGDDSLTGIWVAKFEATAREGVANTTAGDNVTTKSVKILPNVSSWRSISISNMFDVVKKMETDATYGWGTSGNGIDTHLMKNVEWGAVAYLSNSKYGKNAEVWINPYRKGSNPYDYKTGQSGNSVSATQTTTNAYTTTNGMQASTTGNITGIYDMSGGATEYTAAYVNNGHSNLTTYGASILNSENKYKDVYKIGSSDTQTLNYEANSAKVGDAVYETSSQATSNNSWYSDHSYMAYSAGPFFGRGGTAGGGAGAGVFCFSYGSGHAVDFYGFRPVLGVGGVI